MQLPIKVTDIYQIEKKNSIGMTVFSYQNKDKHQIHRSKNCYVEKQVDILLIG